MFLKFYLFQNEEPFNYLYKLNTQPEDERHLRGTACQKPPLKSVIVIVGGGFWSDSAPGH